MTMLVLICSLLLFQDEELNVENLDTAGVGDRFTEAVSIFDSVQRSESEPLFQAIVTELEGKAELNDEERFLLTESLKYLGVINYPNGTEAFFEKLIRFDPSYELRARDLSPKIVDVFTRLRDELVGSVVVSAQDTQTLEPLEGAELYVDGRRAGIIDGNTRFFVFNGERRFEIRRNNYEPYDQTLVVRSTEEGLIRGLLTRNAAEIHLVTIPADARVLVNGVEQGRTNSPVSDGYYAKLREMGIPRSSAGYFVINGLQPGRIDISFQKDCFKEKTTFYEVEALEKRLIVPQLLEPAQSFISVATAGDTEGIVFLGTERVGFTPVNSHEVCPGTYELRVRFTDGEFIQKLSLENGDHANVMAEPLPSIAWFGLEDNEEGRPPGDMNAWLEDLRGWNVVTVDPSDTQQVPVNPFPILFGDETMSEENRNGLTRRLTADLYMAARVVRQKVVIRTVEVAFWSPLSRKITVKSFDFREFDNFRTLVASMDVMPTLTRPWLGAKVASLQGVQGGRVLEVHPNGPLADACQRGDTIITVNGSPLRNPRNLYDQVAGEPVTLTLSGRDVVVTPIETIAEVPYEPDTTAVQALLARFEKLAKYHPDILIRQSARFNQARYQFFMGDIKEAYDLFSTMTLDLDYGISQGTLFFYQGLCFRKLQLASEATESFRAVLSYPHATLFDAYGPKAAAWADSEMKNTSF